MSKKAEERALEAYPVKMVNGPIGYEKSVFDFNALCRYIFQEGYEQAEKDYKLTWEDVRTLCDCFMEVGLSSELPARSQELYEEVLHRFKAIKEEK